MRNRDLVNCSLGERSKRIRDLDAGICWVLVFLACVALSLLEAGVCALAACTYIHTYI
jgi:hypothetical protein